jgi:hypothetical protein
VQKKQMEGPKDGGKDEGGLKASGKVGLAGWQQEALEQINKFERLLQKSVEGQLKGAEVAVARPPSLGILGLNDCLAWANRLRGLIGEEERRARNLARPEADADKVPFDLRKGQAPAVGVGDTMTQLLFGDEVGSNYHAATVVARDSSTVVTLEAHVEKNLPAPVFHFYEGGVPGS